MRRADLADRAAVAEAFARRAYHLAFGEGDDRLEDAAAALS